MSDLSAVIMGVVLILTGIGLAYLFLRMAGVFARLGVSVTRITDEVVPILNKAQTTVDGVNLELSRVDEIMQTAVGATKGAEKTVQTVSSAVTAPVRKLTGLAAGAREAVATLRARRAAEKAAATPPPPPPAPVPPIPPESPPVPPVAGQTAATPPPAPEAPKHPRHGSPY